MAKTKPKNLTHITIMIRRDVYEKAKMVATVRTLTAREFIEDAIDTALGQTDLMKEIASKLGTKTKTPKTKAA